MASKKKKPKRKKKPVPRKEPLAVVPPPPMTKEQKRHWWQVQRKDLIGLLLLVGGVGLLCGYALTDKAHLHERFILYMGAGAVLFGVHFLSSDPTEKAILSVAKGVSRVLRGKNGNSTTEHTVPEER